MSRAPGPSPEENKTHEVREHTWRTYDKKIRALSMLFVLTNAIAMLVIICTHCYIHIYASNTTDCKFALASKQIYEVREMRAHLLKCFRIRSIRIPRSMHKQFMYASLWKAAGAIRLMGISACEHPVRTETGDRTGRENCRNWFLACCAARALEPAPEHCNCTRAANLYIVVFVVDVVCSSLSSAG